LNVFALANRHIVQELDIIIGAAVVHPVAAMVVAAVFGDFEDLFLQVSEFFFCLI
jgi:hypothetical protein